MTSSHKMSKKTTSYCLVYMHLRSCASDAGKATYERTDGMDESHRDHSSSSCHTHLLKKTRGIGRSSGSGSDGVRFVVGQRHYLELCDDFPEILGNALSLCVPSWRQWAAKIGVIV